MYYECDPKKNKSCPKTYCKYNPQAIMRECRLTEHAEYAKTDWRGRPKPGHKWARKTMSDWSFEWRYRIAQAGYEIKRIARGIQSKMLHHGDGAGR